MSSSVSWTRRLAVRVGGAAGAAVVLAGVGPSGPMEVSLRSADGHAAPSAAPSATPSPKVKEPKVAESATENAEDGEHGRIVSTVAKCAPRGKDQPVRHGAYVRAAAHGESLTTPWGTFDLATLAGAERLCAAFPSPTAAEAKTHGKPDKATKPHGTKR